MTEKRLPPDGRRLGALAKAPTAIVGLDEITQGGLPRGRPTLICGSAGCGKTLLAMEFLARGAAQLGEPGVFVAFEENETELTQNVASLGFDLPRLVKEKKLVLEHVRLNRGEIQEAGEYDLEGLFVRLGHAIDSIGARRVVLDTIEALFAGLPNEAILRAELSRLFQWLKHRGVTALITGERGADGRLTRHGLEEYVADCVIVLDHRTVDQISTRWLRILKYRGSLHGTNEFPFLINRTGISVLPITSLALAHQASSERVSTGVPRLDAMLGGAGYFRGSSILVTGTAGSGKSSLAAAFAAAAGRRRERALFLSFEESPQQIIRNMASIGIDLAAWVARRRLEIHAVRPNLQGLEMHLLDMQERIRRLRPQVVVVDPVTNLNSLGNPIEVRSMLTRLIDHLKTHQVTSLFTSLTGGSDREQTSEAAISSLMDTWILLRNLEQGGERNRGLYVLKSRGMDHSNQIREFRLSNDGISLTDVYVGAGQVLAGASRVAQEARDAAEAIEQSDQLARLRRAVEQKRDAAEARIALVRSELDAELDELGQSIKQQELRVQARERETRQITRLRAADSLSARIPGSRKREGGRR